MVPKTILEYHFQNEFPVVFVIDDDTVIVKEATKHINENKTYNIEYKTGELKLGQDITKIFVPEEQVKEVYIYEMKNGLTKVNINNC